MVARGRVPAACGGTNFSNAIGHLRRDRFYAIEKADESQEILIEISRIYSENSEEFDWGGGFFSRVDGPGLEGETAPMIGRSALSTTEFGADRTEKAPANPPPDLFRGASAFRSRAA
jgi:hypothetical protein